MPAYLTPNYAVMLLLLLFSPLAMPAARATLACSSVSTFAQTTEFSKSADGCGNDCEKKIASVAGCDLSGSQAATEKLKEAMLQGADDQKQSGLKSGMVANDGAEKTKAAQEANKKLSKWTAKTTTAVKDRAVVRAKRLVSWVSGEGPRPFAKLPGGSRKAVSFAEYIGQKNGGPSLKDPRAKSGRPGKPGSPDSGARTTYETNPTDIGPAPATTPSYEPGGAAGSASGSSQISPKGRFDPLGRFIPDPVELAKAKADLRLAQRAEAAISRNELFPRQEAQKANDPALREELLTIAAAQELKQETKHEEVRLTHQLEKLVEIAVTSKKNVQGLDSLPADGKGVNPEPRATDAAAEGPRAKGPTEPEDAPGTSGAAVDQASSEGVELASSPVPANEKEASAVEENAPKERAGHPRESLRAKLRAYLKAKEGTASILDSTFDGKLERHAAGPEEEQAHGLGDVIGSAFSAAREATFSMRMSETEAEVNGFLTESQRELASLSAGGVLQPDSPGLFIRVNLAHRRCQEHRCVRARAN